MTTQTEKFPVPTRFVAFYSYKGGVGRTLAMANCARALAARGKKLVLLDFDLEAPGLLHFDVFKPKLGEKKSSAGFVEYLEACLQDGPPDELDSYVHECKGKDTDEGKIWLMPAGRHEEPGYSAFLNDMNWNDFYTRQDGYKILENLRGHIIERYRPDYVFIDARTGLSEIGGIATHQLADIVVLVFNLNGQNLNGAKLVFDSIGKAPLYPAVILVASPVPVMPMDKGTPFYKKMQDIKKDFAGAYNSDNEKQPLVIPYHPLLAFEDRLLVDDGDLFSSDAPYLRLVETIQEVAGVDADYYLQQMAEPMQRGDWKQVQELAQQGLAENPADIYLLLNLSLAYYFTGMLEKTISAIDELLRHHADTVELAAQQTVAQALYNKGVVLGQLQRGEDEIAAYDELLRRFGDSPTLALQEQVAKALYNRGFVLGQLQRGDEEIAAYDELLHRFGESQALALQEQVAKTLVNKGVALGQLQRDEEVIAACDELLRRFGDSPVLALQEQVAKALLNKGATLRQLQRGETAISTYDELLQRFDDSPALTLQELIAKALLNKGATLGQLQQREDEIAVYDELQRRFGDSPTLALQEPIAKALLNKGATLGQLQQREDEIAVYDELQRRFGGSPTLALQEPVARALLNKGFALGQLQRSEDEIAAYDDLLQRFTDSPESVLQKHVSRTLNARGFALLLKAKKVSNNSEMRQELLQTALSQFEQALVHAVQEERAIVLGNQGYALFLLGRTAESEQLLQEALTLGGQELYEGELADSHVDPLPEDDAFRILLDRLWSEVSAQKPS